jgi:uncharacterized protein (TIRG00374 family)
LAFAFIWSRWDEIRHVFISYQSGNLLWLALALILQLTWLVNTTFTYQAIYRLLDLPITLRQLFPLVVTSNFINVATPSAGIAGLAVFINDARRHNRSTARVTIAGVLFILFEYVGFLSILAVGLLVLFQHHHLNVAEILAAIVLLTMALALAGVIVLGIRSPWQLKRVLRAGARIVNHLLFPLLQHPLLSEERAHEFASEAAEGLGALGTDWRAYIVPAAFAFSGQALLITILLLTFLAFGQSVVLTTVIAGFSMGFLFMIVSPTPSGVGVVEIAMPTTIIALGTPDGAATLIALAYRGLTFWLPFGYGFVTLRILEYRWGRLPNKSLEKRL